MPAPVGDGSAGADDGTPLVLGGYVVEGAVVVGRIVVDGAEVSTADDGPDDGAGCVDDGATGRGTTVVAGARVGRRVGCRSAGSDEAGRTRK